MDAVDIVVNRNAKMELEFPPDWRVLRELRMFVTSLVFTVAESDSVAERVSMVVTELAENAVKYSSEHSRSTVVRLRVEPTETGIRCEAENFAEPDAILELMRQIQRVNEGDSLDVYIKALSEAEEGTSSKVGLARIRHEGQMTISCQVSDSKVRMVAEMSRV
jgi:hypothetical protein